MEPLATGQLHRGWDCWEVLSRHPLPADFRLSLLLSAQPSPRPPALSWRPASSASMDGGWMLLSGSQRGAAGGGGGLGGILAHLTL